MENTEVDLTANVDLTEDAIKTYEEDYDMKISEKEEQKNMIYQ